MGFPIQLYLVWYGEGEAELDVGGTTGAAACLWPMGSISIAAVRVSLQWQFDTTSKDACRTVVDSAVSIDCVRFV